jgi:regulator of sirC expression with transglutaminase-like and TPR domain
VVDHLDRFTEICSEQTPRLDSGLAVIACAFNPNATEAQLIQNLDDLASQIDREHRVSFGTDISDGSPSEFCRALFGVAGFQGDRAQYSNPANSLLDQILERRLGLPITLSILGIELGRRCGISFVGIGMPSHFLIRQSNNGDEFYDPFSGGAALSLSQVQLLFQSLQGPQQRFDQAYVAPTEHHLILLRVLNNLQAAYTRLADRQHLTMTLRLKTAMPQCQPETFMQLAVVLGSIGDFLHAAEIHDRLCVTDPRNVAAHERAAREFRARLN